MPQERSGAIRWTYDVTCVLILIGVTLPVGALKAVANSQPVALAESDKSTRKVSFTNNYKRQIPRLVESCRLGGYVFSLGRTAIRCLSIEKCRSGDVGCYSVTFRIDENYSKITVKWYELKGYQNDTAKYQKKVALHQQIYEFKDFRRNPNPDHVVSIEFNLGELPNGTYRVTLKGESTETRNNNKCEFTYNFDGKEFIAVPELPQRRR